MLNVWRTTLDVKPLKYSAVLFIIFALTNTRHTHTHNAKILVMPKHAFYLF